MGGRRQLRINRFDRPTRVLSADADLSFIPVTSNASWVGWTEPVGTRSTTRSPALAPGDAARHAGRAGRRRHRAAEVVGERAIYVPDGFDVGRHDLGGPRGQPFHRWTQLHLKLYRLDPRAGVHLDLAIGALDLHPAQLLDQPLGAPRP